MKKMLGFRSALITSMSGLIIFCLLVSNWMSYNEIRDNTVEDVNELSKSMVRYEADKVETWFQSKAKLIDELSNNYVNGSYQDNFVGIAKLAKTAGDVSAIYIGFDDGRAYSTSVGDAWVDGVAKLELYDPTKRPWYSQAKASNVLDITEVYPDATTGNDVVSIIKVMNDGVALADIELTILGDTVKGINQPGAISVITDEQGNVLASTSKVVVVGTPFRNAGMADLEREMLSQDEMMQDYTLNGVDKIAFTKSIQLVNGKKWYLFVGIDKSVAYASLGTALNQAVLSSIVMIIIGIAVLLLVLQALYRPILLLKEMVHDLSKGNGDLTSRLPVKNNDDLGLISENINLFIEKLQRLMLDVSQSSNEIDDSIQKLRGEVDSNGTILNAHMIETDQIVSAIEEMSVTAKDVAQNSNDTAAFTQTTNAQASKSKESVGEATAIVARLVNEVENTSNSISEIERNTSDINNVLKVIGDIADQTNLLALNAAIEAARAGEYGRGFAVVADEVRALAAKTQDSTTEIEQTLLQLREGSSSAISTMGSTKSTCLEVAQSTEVVASDLGSINDSVSQINDLNLQIATAAEEQSCVSDEIARNMTAISDMANELVVNGNNSLDQTIELANANVNLKALVAQFKLS
jgi:methyl-accepting chemotaxis protein